MSKWNELKSKMEKMHGNVSETISFQELHGHHPTHLRAKEYLLWKLLQEMEKLEEKERKIEEEKLLKNSSRRRDATKEEEENFWKEWDKLTDEQFDEEVDQEYLEKGYWTIHWKGASFGAWRDDGYDEMGIEITLGSDWDLGGQGNCLDLIEIEEEKKTCWNCNRPQIESNIIICPKKGDLSEEIENCEYWEGK